MAELSELTSSRGVFLITPSNDDDLTYVTRAISFSAVGALHIIDSNDNEVTIPSGSLAAGQMHPLRVKKIFSTGTGATNIVGYV